MELKKMEDWGAIVGIFLIIIVLVVGAFYFVGQRMEKSKEFKANMDRAIATTSTAASLDEISNLEKDAGSMNFDNLGDGIDKL